MSLVLALVASLVGKSSIADDDLRRLMSEGRYSEVAATGQKIGTAHGLAVAAMALGNEARCNHRHDPARRQSLFQQVRDLAERSIAVDPKEVKGWRQLARARARLLEFRRYDISHTEAIEAVRSVVSALDQAKALEPDHPAAYLALGRVEIAKLVESRRAMFGLFSLMGDRELALAELCRAVRLAEDQESPVVKVGVSLTVAESLWRLDGDRYRSDVLRFLDRALAPCNGDAVCACLQREASDYLVAVRAAKPDSNPESADPFCTTDKN
ncbi:MAG: hypothetical protein KIT00_02515 [Rhodospirillales bacterium]|nr:hypothetical protein [Rhodospirillales bacterium]